MLTFIGQSRRVAADTSADPYVYGPSPPNTWNDEVRAIVRSRIMLSGTDLLF